MYDATTYTLFIALGTRTVQVEGVEGLAFINTQMEAHGHGMQPFKIGGQPVAWARVVSKYTQ